MDVAFMHDILTRLITHGWLVPNGQCDHKITTKRTGNYGVMSFVFDLIGDNDNNTHLPFHISISLSSIVLPPTTSSQCTTSEIPSYWSQKPEARRAHRALVFSASLLSIALFGLGRFYIGFVDFVDRYPVLYFQAFERLLALRSDFGSRYVPRVGFAFLDDFLGWERGGSRWYINLDEINRTRLQNNNKYMDLYGCGRE